MLRSLRSFEDDLFRRFDELRRELEAMFPWSGFGPAPSIRATKADFPALNIGSTDEAVYLYAFLPGVDPSGIEITLEGNVLTLSGERRAVGDVDSPEETVFDLQERYSGPFRRVVALPEAVDPDQVSATYRNGVLTVKVLKKGARQPKKIDIKVE